MGARKCGAWLSPWPTLRREHRSRSRPRRSRLRGTRSHSSTTSSRRTWCRRRLDTIRNPIAAPRRSNSRHCGRRLARPVLARQAHPLLPQVRASCRRNTPVRAGQPSQRHASETMQGCDRTTSVAPTLLHRFSHPVASGWRARDNASRREVFAVLGCHRRRSCRRCWIADRCRGSSRDRCRSRSPGTPGVLPASPAAKLMRPINSRLYFAHGPRTILSKLFPLATK